MLVNNKYIPLVTSKTLICCSALTLVELIEERRASNVSNKASLRVLLADMFKGVFK